MKKTLKELQKEYDEALNIRNMVDADFVLKSMDLKEQTLKLAKYKTGQKVKVKILSFYGDDRIEIGIIRKIITKEKYSDKLIIAYKIGKIIKSGAIHKTLDIYYSAIEEENVIEVIK